MILVEYPDREVLMSGLALKIVGDLKTRLSQENAASLAVPGGTTPAPAFEVISKANLDWARIHVMLTDERWLPEDHERSNTGLLRRHLLKNKAKDAPYVPLYGGTDTPEASIDALADGVLPHLPISVMLLGMGADMHTASIFPGADRLIEALSPNAPPLMAMRAPGAPEPRITLTAPVLQSAQSVHVLITGAEKREALERAQSLSPVEAPIATILKSATFHWAE